MRSSLQRARTVQSNAASLNFFYCVYCLHIAQIPCMCTRLREEKSKTADGLTTCQANEYKQQRILSVNIRNYKSNSKFFFCFKIYFQALAGLVEIPAIAMAIFLIMCVGKKWILFSTMFFAGIACLCITFVDDTPSIQWMKISFLMLSKSFQVSFRI